VDEVRQIMRGRHHLSYGAKDDFALETSDSFLALWKNISSTFFFVTIAIASISLVVGGIVIMNIMLVSVTERTREIGLRKAVGARGRDILTQFLIESLVLSIIGGAIGVGLGWIATVLGTALVPQLTLSVSADAIVLATAVSSFIGIFFGLYPASRAARMK